MKMFFPKSKVLVFDVEYVCPDEYKRQFNQMKKEAKLGVKLLNQINMIGNMKFLRDCSLSLRLCMVTYVKWQQPLVYGTSVNFTGQRKSDENA